MKRLHDTREHGQAMAEFALVLPVLLIVILSGLQLGAVFFQSQQLSAAVSEGARRGIVSSQAPDPVGEVTAAVHAAAPALEAASMPVSVSSSWEIGEPLTVSASYPVSVDVLGLIVYEGTITNERTMRVAS